MTDMKLPNDTTLEEYAEKLKSITKEEITVEILEDAINNCFIRRTEHAAQKKYTTEIWNEVEELQTAIGVMFEKLEKQKHQTKYGTFSMKLEEGYRLPKDDDSRAAFFAYLRDRGVYDTMITVNARTLETFVKDEVEIKEQEGDFEFVPPGIERKDPQQKYSMRKS
jgi:hypothetical protein